MVFIYLLSKLWSKYIRIKVPSTLSEFTLYIL
nr:MAG TPA: hypothetical protein [Caudoviricetes sp.]